MDKIYDLIDAAAKTKGIKGLAYEMDKGESTLRNELSRQPGYKLGLGTAILILKKTGDLRALDCIEQEVGRIAFAVPKNLHKNNKTFLSFIKQLSKEFSGAISELSDAIDDDDVEIDELKRCKKEIVELTQACLQVNAFLDIHLKEGADR